MYGTVARMRLKPGMEQKMLAHTKQYEGMKIDGLMSTFVYRMDADANEFYMAVVFRDRDSYSKNADDPAQDTRYREMMEMLDGEPEWHDGEIVYQAMS